MGAKRFRHNGRLTSGRTKYWISFHDGVKTHDDGSDFFDIAGFTNKKKRDKFVDGLLRDGYKEGA